MGQKSHIQSALEAYEDARMSGLCHVGAMELAVGKTSGQQRRELWKELEAVMKQGQTQAQIHVHVKHVREPASHGDGVRVLIDRLWPRGLTKEKVAADRWIKDVAPSTELRQWFGHDPALWDEFQKRYSAELDTHQEQIKELLELADGKTLTLLFDAKDELHNNAVAMKNYLVRHHRASA